MTVKLTWYGHAGWKIETAKSILLIDPFLSGNPVAPVTPDQVKPDFILVSAGPDGQFFNKGSDPSAYLSLFGACDDIFNTER